MNNNVKPQLEPVKTDFGVKPNDSGGFYFSSHIKITDPNTKEVLVQKRGDN
jgi:hypothetical protein